MKSLLLYKDNLPVNSFLHTLCSFKPFFTNEKSYLVRKRKVVENKSGKKTKVAESSNSPIASTSKSTVAAAAKTDIIWQREQDKRILESNKLKAVEIFKKSRGRGKRPMVRKPLTLPREAQLSESDST